MSPAFCLLPDLGRRGYRELNPGSGACEVSALPLGTTLSPVCFGLFFSFFVFIKVTVKFIRREIHFQQTKSGLYLEWEQRDCGGERERHFLFPMQDMGCFGFFEIGFHCVIQAGLKVANLQELQVCTTTPCLRPQIFGFGLVWLLCFVVLGFELRVWCLLCKNS
jgi:hypothetical protein